MAKKQDKKSGPREFDPRFDDPDEDSLLNDPFNADGTAGGLAARARAASGRRRSTRTGPGCLGLIGGFIQVILNALLLIVLLGILGIGGVYLAQSFGLIERPTSAQTSLLGIPPLVVTQPPTAQPTAAAVVSGGMESMTGGPAEGCGAPVAWWGSVSASFESVVISYAPLFYTPGQSVSETLDATRAARDLIAAAPADDCALPLRETVLQAVDAQVAAITTLQGQDRAGSLPQARLASAQFASIYDLLWETGLNTDSSAPVGLDIPRGGGECPGLADWNAQIAPLLQAFEASMLPTTDPTLNPAGAGPAADSARMVAQSMASLTPPPCASVAHTAALTMANRLADGVLGYLNGQPDASSGAIDYARAAVLLDAYLRWLGLTTA
jgi:hypothetical protein